MPSTPEIDFYCSSPNGLQRRRWANESIIRTLPFETIMLLEGIEKR